MVPLFNIVIQARLYTPSEIIPSAQQARCESIRHSKRGVISISDSQNQKLISGPPLIREISEN